MKALSIRQPWVELILQGRKTLEIRSWNTDYRGPLTIHAAFNVDHGALKQYPIKDPVRGALIGKVSLDAVETLDVRWWEELRRLHCIPGPWDRRYRYAFRFSNPQRFSRITPLSGRSFLFEI